MRGEGDSPDARSVMIFSPAKYGITMHSAFSLTAQRVQVSFERAYQQRDHIDGSEEVDTSPRLRL